MPYKPLRAVVVMVTALLMITCSNTPDRISSIGLQPLGTYDQQQLAFIQQQVQTFFKKPVIVLEPISIPRAFINLSKGERYSADSIIKLLSSQTNDSISHIVGLTHKDIFTSRKDEHGQIKQPYATYGVWGIFGLGYCPGRSCVISDFRLKTNNPRQFSHRIRTVVLHEIGHNLGRPHCKRPTCIMNDANETIKTVDKSGDDYCDDCKNKARLL